MQARRTARPRGEGGIRTPDAGITDVTVFETAAFNHSATSPRQSVSTASRYFNRTIVCPIASPNSKPRLEALGIIRIVLPLPVLLDPGY